MIFSSTIEQQTMTITVQIPGIENNNVTEN